LKVLAAGWVSSAEACELSGVSRSRVVRAARSGVLVARKGSDRRWLIDRASLAAWPVPVVPGRAKVRSDRYVSAGRRPHVELLAATGLADEDLAVRLGVAVSRVRRWRSAGVPNLYVGRLRCFLDQGGPADRS
jgi:hypothetical protein